jgi:type IV pilus assembly protein PilF
MGKKSWILIMLFLIVCAIGACSSTPRTNENQTELAKASRNLGEAYLRENNYSAALKELKKSEGLNPGDHFVQYDLGVVYYELEKYDLAIQHFKKSLDIQHDYAPALNSLGNAYAAKADWDNAIYYYKQAAENLVYATPYLPLTGLGVAYYNKNELNLSERYFLQAIKQKSDYLQALVGLAKTYTAMGKFSDAQGLLERAASISPRSAGVYFELAKVYTRTGDYRRAYSAYQKVMELAPDSVTAQEALREANRLKDRF